MLLDREEGHPKEFSCCDLFVRSKITNVVSEPYVLGRLGGLARADAIAARSADETFGLDEPRPQRHDRHAERFEVVGAVAREPVCAEIAAARLYCSPFVRRTTHRSTALFVIACGMLEYGRTPPKLLQTVKHDRFLMVFRFT